MAPPYERTVKMPGNPPDYLLNFDASFYKAAFANMPAGLMIVRGDTTLLDANFYLFDAFKLPHADVKGRMFGNIFPCSKVYETDIICGEGEDCPECDIRGCLNALLSGGPPLENALLNHEFITGDGPASNGFR